MIMPGSVAISSARVEPELLHYLDTSWQSIIAADVDGITSTPYKIDQSAPNLNRYSARADGRPAHRRSRLRHPRHARAPPAGESCVMSTAPASMIVFIPLAIRKRNGRPKILPPADMIPANDGGVDSHVLKAIARAWSWRRKLESGAATTIQDIAQAEDISDRYVGRMLRRAYLAPAVLEKILIARVSPAVSLKDLTMAAELPRMEQVAAVFGPQP
jgi:hypothetical protein